MKLSNCSSRGLWISTNGWNHFSSLPKKYLPTKLTRAALVGYRHPMTLMELFNWTRNSGIFWVSLLKAKEYSRGKVSASHSLEDCGNSEAVVSAAVRLSRDPLGVKSPRNSWASSGSWSSWGAGNSKNSRYLEVSWHFGASCCSWAFGGCWGSNFWGSWPDGAFWKSEDF